MTKTPYVPREGSAPARLLAHLHAHGGTLRNIEAAAVLGIPDKNVPPALLAAVKHGVLIKTSAGYSLPDAQPVDAPADTTWGDGGKPTFPSAPPRVGGAAPTAAIKPRHKMRTLKSVAADFHAEMAAHADHVDAKRMQNRRETLLVTVPIPEPASLRQVGGTHYKEMAVQPWDVVDGWPIEQRIGYYRGNALKYLMRMGSKDQDAQEISKGRHYIEKLLEVLQEQDVQVSAA